MHDVKHETNACQKLEFIQRFEWSHPIVLSEYLLYYNIFPSAQMGQNMAHHPRIHTFKISCVDGNIL